MGSLALFLPVTLFIGIFNVDQLDPWRVYFGYFFPQFPLTVIASQLSGSNLINLSLPVAWATLFLLIPVYYGLYIYLD